jgi:hypothetical protein
MFDDERLVLDPREGERVSGSSGERAVVGVAAIALLGGLLILGGNFLASLGDDEAGRDSATARASARHSPTARPSPTPRPLREVTIAPGTPPPPRLPTNAFYGFIEAKVDIVMRDGPRNDATEVGLLAAGELAFAEEQAVDGDWYHVTAPEGAGWIQVSDGSTDFAERVTTDFATGPDVWSITAGGEGYVALASRYTPDNPSGQLGLYSPDGLFWVEAPFAARGAWTTLVAWGPAGWLAVTEHEAPAGGPGTTWVSQLSDGRWDPVGSFSAIDSIYPTQLIGSDVGYLLIAQGGGRGPTPQQLVGSWFSTDGFTWREGAPIGLEEVGWINVAAVPGGFYAWNPGPVPGPRPSGGPATAWGAFSANGRAWTPVYGGPFGGTMRIVGLDDRVVAFDVDAATLAIRTWTATVDGGTFRWQETPVEDPAFTGAGVTALTGSGERAVAFGWDLETDAPLAWRQEGAGEDWQRTELPAEFGGIPRVAAVGANGTVVVGYRPSVRSTNPIFWRESEPGAFAPETNPVFDPVPNPTAADCAELSANPLALLFMDRSLAVACHGSEPLTFRAWVEVCIDCVAVPQQEGGGPASWMVNGEHQLWFGLGPGMGWSQPAVPDPDLVSNVNIGPGGNPGWVQVTGHFDDPRSVDCRATPIPAEYSYYAGHAEAVRTCRQQFVVTDLQPTAEP